MKTCGWRSNFLTGKIVIDVDHHASRRSLELDPGNTHTVARLRVLGAD